MSTWFIAFSGKYHPFDVLKRKIYFLLPDVAPNQTFASFTEIHLLRCAWD